MYNKTRCDGIDTRCTNICALYPCLEWIYAPEHWTRIKIISKKWLKKSSISSLGYGYLFRNCISTVNPEDLHSFYSWTDTVNPTKCERLIFLLRFTFERLCSRHSWRWVGRRRARDFWSNFLRGRVGGQSEKKKRRSRKRKRSGSRFRVAWHGGWLAFHALPCPRFINCGAKDKVRRVATLGPFSWWTSNAARRSCRRNWANACFVMAFPSFFCCQRKNTRMCHGMRLSHIHTLALARKLGKAAFRLTWNCLWLGNFALKPLKMSTWK